jgi:hypothetical protein
MRWYGYILRKACGEDFKECFSKRKTFKRETKIKMATTG